MIRKGYAGLLGPKGQLQTATETVEKLCDRIASATLLEVICLLLFYYHYLI